MKETDFVETKSMIFTNYIFNTYNNFLKNTIDKNALNLFLKLQFHNNKEAVFKSELEKYINRLLKVLKKLKLNDYYYNKLVVNLYLIQILNKDSKGVVLFPLPYFDVTLYSEKYPTSFTSIHCVCTYIFEVYFQQLCVYSKYQLVRDTKKYSYFYQKTHTVEFDELEEFYEQIIFGFFDLETNEIKELEGFLENLINIMSYVVIIGYINNCLSVKEYDINDFRYNIPHLFYDDVQKSLPKRVDYDKKILLSYKWNSKFYTDLRDIYNLFSDEFDCGFKEFAKIFNGMPINDIKPIKTNFTLAELIYFEHLLKEKGFIKKESNPSNMRLIRSFIKNTGEYFKSSSVSSIRSQIMGDEFNSVLKLDKRKLIEEKFNKIK